MNTPVTAMRSSMRFETMLTVRAVGFCRISPSRIGSSPSVSAGGPSMMILIHRRSSAEKGDSNSGPNTISKIVHRNTVSTDATLTVSWNWMNRLKFS